MVDVLESKLDLWFSCKDLKNKDLLSKSDPLGVLYQRDVLTNRWQEVGKTEMILNDLNPVFRKHFSLIYRFEENQEFKIEIYDVDSNDVSQLDSHDFLGRVEFRLADLVSAHQQHLHMPLLKLNRNVKQRNSTIDLYCEEIGANRCNFVCNMRGSGLPKMDWFGKADPFVRIFRQGANDEKEQWVQVHETEVIKKTYQPIFAQFKIPLNKLCNNDEHRQLRFVCYDWDGDNSEPELIGEFNTSVNEMKRGKMEYMLINTKKYPAKDATKSKYQKYIKKGASGKITFDPQRTCFEPCYTFLDFLKGGMEISLMVAIYFTGSNGNPNDPRSLHYIGNNGNQYLTAIRSVGHILAPYDHDNMIPVWGFGARLIETNVVSHCFPLNFAGGNPEVHGVQGIEQAYQNSFRHMKLSGPTFFSEIIDTANMMTQQAAQEAYTNGRQSYSILLILTDGIINDMRRTIDAVVRASNQPLSIIIIGVGNADFRAMDTLDGDDVRLCDSNGNYAARDIVQFVPFNRFLNTHISQLAKETLQEVPGQVLSFARSINLHPLVPSEQDQKIAMDNYAAPPPPENPAAQAI